MQQHYQVINLHNIIRTQQSKIQQLREQLRIANERQQNRYGQFMEKNRITVQQKQKMIQYLKQEVLKLQKNNTSGAIDFNDKIQKQKDKYEKQIIMLKRKNLQQQAKNKRLESQYQLQTQTLMNQIQNMSSQLQKQAHTKALLTAQISKLNYFYKNSIFQIGKRKQTLLWVEKFTQYLENIQNKQKRTLDDVSSFVKNQVNGLKNVLIELVKEIGKNQQQIRKASIFTTGDISKILQKAMQQCSKVEHQNNQFWNTLLKQHAQASRLQQIRFLQSEISKLKQKHTLQIQDLKSLIKSLQNQKKTVILGFQQLRSLTQNRQANYKEQIRYLKKTIQQLLQKGTQRDRQFQAEIKVLSNQIQNISERYYQNIQMPMRRANVKISQQMQQVKLQVSRIQSNSSLKNTFQNMEKILQKLVQQSSFDEKSQFVNFLQQQNQNISEIMENMHGRQNTLSKVYTDRYNTFQKQFQQLTEEEQLVLKQKYNKSQYEVVLAKKHIAKLKQYCQNLQKKNLPSWHKKQKQTNLLQKLVQLEAQNQALKQNIDSMRSQIQKQSQNLRKKYELKSISEELNYNCQQNVKIGLLKVNQIHKKIQQHIRVSKTNIYQMRQALKSVKNILFKPVQSLEILAKEVSQIGLAGQQLSVRRNGLNNQSFTGAQTQRSFHASFSPSQEINAYRQILAKRNDNYQSMNKLFSQLIKLLRQNGKQNKQKDKNFGQSKIEETSSKKSTNNLKFIQKRIKDLQAQKIKQKQQMLQKIQASVQSLQKINQKINKSATLKNNLSKFQSNLDAKITQIVKKTQIKLDKSEITGLKEEVIADVKSKLLEANHQNEGLRKQMSILYAQKKL